MSISLVLVVFIIWYSWDLECTRERAVIGGLSKSLDGEDVAGRDYLVNTLSRICDARGHAKQQARRYFINVMIVWLIIDVYMRSIPTLTLLVIVPGFILYALLVVFIRNHNGCPAHQALVRQWVQSSSSAQRVIQDQAREVRDDQCFKSLFGRGLDELIANPVEEQTA